MYVAHLAEEAATSLQRALMRMKIQSRAMQNLILPVLYSDHLQ